MAAWLEAQNSRAVQARSGIVLVMGMAAVLRGLAAAVWGAPCRCASAPRRFPPKDGPAKDWCGARNFTGVTRGDPGSDAE
ncbi:hypothetical protein PSm6_23550 [Pseudomonas solani]|uniref:Uncharacterized protein n=1 Tax=Pseudomonas solani TaxID=2731552 RepID=A0ABM7L965_9PSED|nr:hypothetical protein PSm6_23550 [Pseudomonas solani]